MRNSFLDKVMLQRAEEQVADRERVRQQLLRSIAVRSPQRKTGPRPTVPGGPCRQCGKHVEQHPGRKERRFCRKACGTLYRYHQARREAANNGR